MKAYWIPYIKFAEVITPDMVPAVHPPKIPIVIDMSVRIGLKSNVATILGRVRYDAELIPIISKASICSVTLIVPISEAIFDPTFPARIRAATVDENSSIIESRQPRPIRYAG
jgi:hypothetical protein